MGKQSQASGNPNLADTIDKTIHEPVRYIVMAHLYSVDSLDYTFLHRQTGFTYGNLTFHLNKLEAAGYVDIEKKVVGKKVYTVLQMTSSGRSSFLEYRKNIRSLLDGMVDVED